MQNTARNHCWNAREEYGFFKILKVFGIAVLAVSVLCSYADPAFAARGKKRSYGKASSKTIANEKYAAIVIDAETMDVVYQANPDAVRHPASLTKMMTLYMTFDALKRGRLNLNQRLKVSSHAASMPQTNLALSPGDTIRVEDAIKALVTRSANDVAVVLAEGLGQSEPQFAASMTNQAQRLGMTHTTFRNASGLPDVRQVTTARDLAKLGLALRRDFPQYYPYFSVTSFSYGGRTYTTHNHVLTDMQGVDGIKTGYVNMSGFNLVTSIKRDGYSLVGVVMGGKTARSRDEHMKDLLKRSLRQVASLHAPGAKPDKMYASTNSTMTDAQDYAPEVPVAAATSNAPRTTAQYVREQVVAPQTIAAPAANIQPVSYQVASTGNAVYTTDSPGTLWGIQVGAFNESRDAFMAAVNAMNLASHELAGSEIKVNDPAGDAERVFRARIANITEAQARRACRVLLAHNEACFVFHADQNS